MLSRAKLVASFTQHTNLLHNSLIRTLITPRCRPWIPWHLSTFVTVLPFFNTRFVLQCSCCAGVFVVSAIVTLSRFLFVLHRSDSLISNIALPLFDSFFFFRYWWRAGCWCPTPHWCYPSTELLLHESELFVAHFFAFLLIADFLLTLHSFSFHR
jgi:hypothetical protein